MDHTFTLDDLEALHPGPELEKALQLLECNTHGDIRITASGMVEGLDVPFADYIRKRARELREAADSGTGASRVAVANPARVDTLHISRHFYAASTDGEQARIDADRNLWELSEQLATAIGAYEAAIRTHELAQAEEQERRTRREVFERASAGQAAWMGHLANGGRGHLEARHKAEGNGDKSKER